MRDQPAALQSTTGETMALESVDARGHVRGLLFELAVEQRYRNPHDTNVEAVYTFPLPVEAVLLDLEITLGERRLVATVVEKKQAERDYEQAIDKGDTAIMLERASDGLCTLNLGNLMAGESATIRYRYAQLLRFEHGSVRLAIPTVIAPRYGDPKAARLHAHQVPTNDLAVAYPFSLTLDLEGEIAKGTVASPSHAISTKATAKGMRVALARDAFLDRDFVLAVEGLSGRSLAVVAKDGDRFVALASFCADVPKSADERPLRLKLLVDCSGSMGGDSIDAARRALHRILASLEPADRFSFSRFGSHVVHETDGMVSASATHVRTTAERLGRMDADLGGTEMADALRAVFAIGGTDGAADVLILTDGEVWDADHLVSEARGARQRVFAVGIGSAPAEGVLRRLAEASGGACEFVAPNEDAEAAILRMFARLRAPRVERADVAWPVAPGWTTPLPSGLFGGETIHAFAGFDVAPLGAITLALRAKDGAPPLTAAAQFDAEVVEDRTLARIAAARRIDTAVEEEKLRLALDYGLLTARTNLIVVYERAAGEKAVDMPRLAHVAQMHAAGWHGVGSVHEVQCVGFASLDIPQCRRHSCLTRHTRGRHDIASPHRTAGSASQCIDNGAGVAGRLHPRAGARRTQRPSAHRRRAGTHGAPPRPCGRAARRGRDRTRRAPGRRGVSRSRRVVGRRCGLSAVATSASGGAAPFRR
ncbi:MAG: VWA domain-containing protein [Betaproteobacteria bacterium]|nr:VWA domain-containing protein [Betaproteobacteria bacterium]